MDILTNEEIKFLEDHKYLYDMIIKAGYCKNYTKDVYNTLSDIHNKHISKHNFTHWCGDCRLQLVKQVYIWYDQIQEKNYNDAMEVFASITNEDVVIDQPEKKKRGRKPKSSQ
jgi:hypothetical protein